MMNRTESAKKDIMVCGGCAATYPLSGIQAARLEWVLAEIKAQNDIPVGERMMNQIHKELRAKESREG